MAVTAAEIAALPTYTTAQKLAWMEAQYMEAARALAMGTAGRSITRQSLAALGEEVSRLKAQLEAEAAGQNGGGIALAQFGEAQ